MVERRPPPPRSRPWGAGAGLCKLLSAGCSRGTAGPWSQGLAPVWVDHRALGSASLSLGL